MALRTIPYMEIFENPKQWLESFQEGWLAHYEETGQFDWEKYVYPKNSQPPSGERVRLAESRLLLVSTAGAYLAGAQQPFQADEPFGDYSIRIFPAGTPFKALAYANHHYDPRFVQADPQVLLPLRHLEDMAQSGLIGELAASVVSFSGHQPNAIRVVKEVVPAVLGAAQEAGADAALFVPAGPLCIQSAGLIARGLEVNGIATAMTSWSAGLMHLIAPPRAAATQLKRGCTLGKPGDAAQQRRVLAATLALLEQDAPVEMLILDERVE